MRLGALTVSTPFVLAPMEEHTSLPLRRLMRRHGAGLLYTERLDAADVAALDRRALRLLGTEPGLRPDVAQFSGRDGAVLAAAAVIAVERGFQAVDLNCDCPVRRVLDAGAGGALMADSALIGALVAMMVAAVRVPVTVKLRSGPDPGRETAVEAALAAQAGGAAAVMVHGRFVAQGYVDEADWTVIRRVKQAVTIPVIGSGSVRNADDAVRMLRDTGADGVAIARGCLGNPWIFAAARDLHGAGRRREPPTCEERGRALLALVEDELRFYGRERGLARLPRTACYFTKVLPCFPRFRAEVRGLRSIHDLRRIVWSEWFRGECR